MTADFDNAYSGKLPAADHASITASGYAINERGWSTPAEQVLAIRETENEDSPLSDAPSSEEEEDFGIAVGEDGEEDLGVYQSHPQGAIV